MSSWMQLHKMQLVKTGPSLKERKVAAAHHLAIVGRLRNFREKLECEMEPESWTLLESQMVTLLADVCDALALTEEERGKVLGSEGERALAEVLESRPVPRSHAGLNERQVKALAHVRRHGMINLSEYRQRCPHWADETLRLDLADLVTRGLLIKNGRKKGTRYVLPE